MRRVEDRQLLEGSGEYLAELRVPGAGELAFLRSPVAHARLKAVGVSRHIGSIKPIVAASAAPGFPIFGMPTLARKKLRFLGETGLFIGMAAVVFVSRATGVEVIER
jgi:carbon-monoxide dehydrogenase large subunit